MHRIGGSDRVSPILSGSPAAPYDHPMDDVTLPPSWSSSLKTRSRPVVFGMSPPWLQPG